MLHMDAVSLHWLSFSTLSPWGVTIATNNLHILLSSCHAWTYRVKHGDGARKRPCVFDDVSTVLFAGFAKKPMRFAIHSCGNVNVMTWIPCKGYRPKSIISTFAAFLLHFSKIASAKLRRVTLPHRSPKAFVQALLAVTTPHPCIDIGHEWTWYLWYWHIHGLSVATNVTIPHPTHPIRDKHQGQQDDVTTNVTIPHPTHPIPDKHQGQQDDVTKNVTIPHPTHPPSQTNNIKDNKMT